MKWMALVVALLLACGPKRENQCPGNVTGACVNGEVCSMDHTRGPLNQTPANDPDVPRPAIPVH